MAQIKQMAGMVKSMGNPQGMLNMMLQRNPQAANVLKQSGGDPKKAFYAMAKQMNVNPDDILSMLK